MADFRWQIVRYGSIEQGKNAGAEPFGRQAAGFGIDRYKPAGVNWFTPDNFVFG